MARRKRAVFRIAKKRHRPAKKRGAAKRNPKRGVKRKKPRHARARRGGKYYYIH